jgi:NADH-quinone oxidoreductase subunit G
MDVHLGLPDAAAARRELGLLGQDPAGDHQAAGGARATPQPVSNRGGGSRGVTLPGPGQAVLATWNSLLGGGRMQDGEPNLAGTARAAVARISAATAAEVGTTAGGKVTVATERGAVTVPVEIAEVPDRVVWLPANSTGRGLRRELGAGHGGLVMLRSAE